MYEVGLVPGAKAVYEAADRPLAVKLSRCLARLESNPRDGNNVKRLAGDWSGYWRYRVGDWRVIYRIDDRARRVYIVAIAHRRDVYE